MCETHVVALSVLADELLATRRGQAALEELQRPVEIADDAPSDDDDVQTEPAAPPPAPPAPAFMISLRSADQTKRFKVKANTPFSVVFDAFFTTNPSLDRRKTRFKFDGEAVLPTQTPGMLGLEDDDVIDVC